MSRNGQPPNPPGAVDQVPAAIVVRAYRLAPGSRFGTHRHDTHQVVWARNGVLTVSTEGGEWILPPTRALWIPAGTAHQTAALASTAMRSLNLTQGPGLPSWSAPQPLAVGPLVADLIDHLAQSALEAGRRARAQAVLIDNLEPVAARSIDVPMPTDPRALDVARALLADPADPRTLTQWGRQVGSSARTLARSFGTDTGLTFARWRTAVRLRAALAHLAQGDPVTRVAGRVGYATPSAFVAAFVRETGLTPGSYFHGGPPTL
ncbi:AraC family transcriptional regulator [Kitasatospora sp. NBC_01266]|uniref:AraC family transcriptional regulator n=1 Tax=Kitasatospora sp. NBC_01266 TaxID=2903572 RepID=UPI002E38115F|nr:helix-turn-helix transcriptional regulator [Kitasatospora sp. NBC_01266]